MMATFSDYAQLGQQHRISDYAQLNRGRPTMQRISDENWRQMVDRLVVPQTILAHMRISHLELQTMRMEEGLRDLIVSNLARELATQIIEKGLLRISEQDDDKTATRTYSCSIEVRGG